MSLKNSSVKIKIPKVLKNKLNNNKIGQIYKKFEKSLNVDKVIFLPDEYLAKYVASKTNVEIISWNGKCEVPDKTLNRVKNYKKSQ